MKLTVIVIFILCFLSTFNAQNMRKNDVHPNSGSAITKVEQRGQAIYWDQINERIITTSVIVIEIVVLFFILFYWKRTRKETFHKSNLHIKRNIKALREEKIRPIIDSNSNKNRKTIIDKINLRKLTSRNINNRSKKLSIGKGELILAAKINQMYGRHK